MVKLVERAGQIRVQGPNPCGPTALARVVDRLDRVLTATPGTKPVVTGLEPGLPLRLQRSLDPVLVTPIHDQRNAERAALLTLRLRDIHPPDRHGRQDAMLRCTRTASAILADEVNTTSPSIPAVTRPALRWVTCRTLHSVFDHDRSIIFCKDLTLARSPS